MTELNEIKQNKTKKIQWSVFEFWNEPIEKIIAINQPLVLKKGEKIFKQKPRTIFQKQKSTKSKKKLTALHQNDSWLDKDNIASVLKTRRLKNFV